MRYLKLKLINQNFFILLIIFLNNKIFSFYFYEAAINTGYHYNNLSVHSQKNSDLIKINNSSTTPGANLKVEAGYQKFSVLLGIDYLSASLSEEVQQVNSDKSIKKKSEFNSIWAAHYKLYYGLIFWG